MPWRRLRRQWPAQAALVWLLLALVAVPTLGRLHQVEHAGALEQLRAGQAVQRAQQAAVPLAKAAADTAAVADANAAHGAGAHHGWLALLLAPHTPVDCLLLDQLALGDALYTASSALPPSAPPLAPAASHAGRSATPHVSLFQARGPPAV